MSDYAFVVTQVGERGSAERARADQVSDYIIKPVIEAVGLTLQRADRESTPGQITPLILRNLIESKVVIADLTDRNPNVYYELAIAHAFTKPVISLIDSTRNVAFDTKDERLITLGPYDHETGFALTPAEEAKKALGAALEIVLKEGYMASSLVTEAAAARNLDTMAPADPVAAELASLRESVEEVRTAVQQIPKFNFENTDGDFIQLTRLVIRLIEAGGSTRAFDSVDTKATSGRFDNWYNNLIQVLEAKSGGKKVFPKKGAPSPAQDPWAASPNPWAENPPSPSTGGWGKYSDDPPF